MLDIEELLKKTPFVYFVRGDYYAFGGGVCEKCNNGQRTIPLLPLRYSEYLNLLNNQDTLQNDAWNAYRRIVNIAKNMRGANGKQSLQEQFNSFGFTEKEQEEIQQQLDQRMFFYKHYRLDVFGRA